MVIYEYGKFERLNADPSEFKSYLAEVWKNRPIYLKDYDAKEENESIDEEGNQGFLRFNGEYIKAKNYVGFIQFNGIKVNIYPKLFQFNKEHDYQYYLSNLVYWLSYCHSVKFPFSSVDLSNQKFDNILEILIYIFAHYCEQTITEQIFQCYEEVKEETNYFKGQLVVNDYIRNNISTGNWHKFTCQYEPFIINNLFNRIIKYTARILCQVSNNASSIAKLESISFLLSDVEDIFVTSEDCSKVRLNRLHERYNVILEMCKLFLDNRIVLDGDTNRNLCFLIPMELIFEEFIYNFVRVHLKHFFHEVKYQKSNVSLAMLYEDTEYKGNVFTLKHDIFLSYFNSDTAIVDAKYKLLLEDTEKKKGVSQLDMYQMVSYAIRSKCSTIHLIYPELFEEYGSNKPNKNVKFVVSDEFTEDPKKIDVSIFIHKIPWYLYKESNTEKGIVSLESFRVTDKIIKTSLKSILNA